MIRPILKLFYLQALDVKTANARFALNFFLKSTEYSVTEIDKIFEK